MTTDQAAKRLLVRSVLPIRVMTPAAFLRGIGALDFGGSYAPFGSTPGNLLGDMCQVGGTQIGIHGTRLELHGGNRKLFIGKLCIGMFSKALIDGSIDFLTDMSDKPLTALAAGRGEFLRTLLLEARPQFGLASALLPILFLPLTQLAMHGAIVFARTRREKVSGKGERRYRRSLP